MTAEARIALLEARLAECEARLGISITTPIEQLAEKMNAEVLERLERRPERRRNALAGGKRAAARNQ